MAWLSSNLLVDEGYLITSSLPKHLLVASKSLQQYFDSATFP
jgi:hypothetical protein